MDKDKMQSKLQALSLKNKKLLQSISTHLINNPDQMESKLHEHRFLQQKYNELLGFSQKNVQKYEKLESMLINKEEQVKRLNRILAEVQSGNKMNSLEMRKKKLKQQQQIEAYKKQIDLMKKEVAQTKQQFSNEKNKLQQELEKEKLLTKQKTILAQKTAEEVKKLTLLSEEQDKQLQKLREQNARLKKTNKMDLLNDLSSGVAKLRKRQT